MDSHYHSFDEDEVLGAGGIGGAIIGGAESMSLGRILLALVVVAVLVIIIYWVWIAWTGLGGALNRKGWEVWVSDSCSACRTQRLYLGSSWSYITKKKCRGNAPCPVTAFPTWFNTKTGQVRTGVQNPMELNRMAK